MSSSVVSDSRLALPFGNSRSVRSVRLAIRMVVDELHRTSRRIVRVVGDIGYNIAELRLAGSNKILLQILRVQPQTIQSRRGPTRSTNWIRRVADLVDDVTILSDVVPSSTMACSNRLDIWMMLSKVEPGGRSNAHSALETEVSVKMMSPILV